jgi:hypothetical protein
MVAARYFQEHHKLQMMVCAIKLLGKPTCCATVQVPKQLTGAFVRLRPKYIESTHNSHTDGGHQQLSSRYKRLKCQVCQLFMLKRQLRVVKQPMVETTCRWWGIHGRSHPPGTAATPAFKH